MKGAMKIVLALTVAGSSLVANADIEDAIEYRQSIFTAVKWQFGPMGDMVKGKKDFDATEFKQRASHLAALSHMPWEAFVDGSYQNDEDTSALPAIGTDWSTFTKAMEAFQSSAQGLKKAAESGDMATIKPAFIQVARSCKGCHDQFKD